MKLSINIAEDTELRALIKEQIRGAVRAITREEILKEIAVEVAKKTPSIEAAFTAVVKATIKEKVTGNYWHKSELEAILREEIRAALKVHIQKL